MKKKALALTLLLALLLLMVARNANFGAVKAATNIYGIVNSNTTWTKANSPYTLNGSVLIENGVVLTIMSGVTVNLDGYLMMVNGTLAARGTSKDYIEFNGGEITFTSTSTDWNKITGSGSIISYALVTSSISILDSSPKISNCSLSSIGNSIDISGGSPIISGNNISAFNGSYGLANLQQTNVGIALSNNNTALITENIIDGTNGKACIAIYGGSPTIQRNVFASSVGIDLSLIAFEYARPTIQNNTFAHCSDGILTGISTVALTPTISFNNFENSTGYNIYWVYPANLYAPYNWWGTADAQVINRTIYDFKDDFSSGTVNFLPFLATPNPQAPSSSPITNPPKITILSPSSQTYHESSVSLLFALDKPANWTGYSLDNLPNVTVTGNTTLRSLSNGNHSIVVYCSNTYGNVGASDTIHFAVNSPLPLILTTTAAVAAVIIGTGLLVYFRKRQKEAPRA